jgi:hypothetical protein
MVKTPNQGDNHDATVFGSNCAAKKVAPVTFPPG